MSPLKPAAPNQNNKEFQPDVGNGNHIHSTNSDL